MPTTTARACWMIVALVTAQSAQALTIDLDYSPDSARQFFHDSQRRQAMQAAADVYQQLLTDHLDAIAASGENHWIARLTDPSTGGVALLHDLEVPADTLIVLVGARDLPGQLRAQGGPGGQMVGGSHWDWRRTVLERGQPDAVGPGATDFAPWGGSIAFDTTRPDGTSRQWNFDLDSPPASGQDDFYCLALHELAHVLGFGLSDSWQTWVDPQNHRFTGPAATACFGGPVDLDTDIGRPHLHWKMGTTSTAGLERREQMALMVPVSGGRRELTDLDVAALQDIGWEVQLPQCPLQPGDANQDGHFDQLDVVQVLAAGKYLSGQRATWGEGDFNGGPGGCRGDPPVGDGRFDQLDIVAALRTGEYLANEQRGSQSNTVIGVDQAMAECLARAASVPLMTSASGGPDTDTVAFSVAAAEPSTRVLLLIAALGGIPLCRWRPQRKCFSMGEGFVA